MALSYILTIPIKSYSNINGHDRGPLQMKTLSFDDDVTTMVEVDMGRNPFGMGWWDMMGREWVSVNIGYSKSHCSSFSLQRRKLGISKLLPNPKYRLLRPHA